MKSLSDKQTEALFKDIENGKYHDFYFIYDRKSTDEPNNQKNSLSYQRSQNTRFAKLEKLPIAPLSIRGFCGEGIISESHSGFKENDELIITEGGLVSYRIERPKFQRLFMYLNKGLFKGVICLCWDRISRNKGDDMIIRKLIKRGVDIRFVFTKYDKSSSGELHMDVDSMFSAHHSRVTSEKVSITFKHAREKGKCTNRAPIGYLNVGNMDFKPQDPERAPVIKKMFELYATNGWSLSDLASYAREQGMVTVPMRRRRTEEEKLAEEDGSDEKPDIPQVSRPINANHVHRILTNPFYIAKVPVGGGLYGQSTSHEAIVSEDIYYEVQKLLKKNKTSVHYTEKIDLPLRGFVRCAHCRRVSTPYIQKGIQYFSSRCVKGCENTCKNFNLDYIEKEIGKLIAKLQYTQDELDEMDARTSTEIALFENKRHDEIEQMERKKRKLREDLAFLRSNKLSLLKTGAYTAEAIVAEETKLESGINALINDEHTSEVAMSETIKDIMKLSELLKNTVPYYDFANSQEKQEIIRIIFSELYLSGNTLTYKVQKGFEAFENRFISNCDPTENRTPLLALKRRCPNR